MSRAYKFADQRQAYFVSFAVVYWIDVFTRANYCQIVLDSLRYCQQNKGLILHGWCIMPSHVHLVMATNGVPMQDILRDIKRHTARQLLTAIEANAIESRKAWMLWMMDRAGKQHGRNEKHQFWQHDSHPIELVTQPFFDQKLEYLHQNPVKAGFVEQAHHWSWSSARNYADRQIIGPLDLVFAGR